jgi:general secretion pathway protein L
MTPPISKAALISLDWQRLVSDLKVAWQGMGQWPFFRWFTPSYATRVTFPDGSARNLVGSGGQTAASDEAPKFRGYLLPEDLVLWQTVELPALGAQEIASALSFQVGTHSPFAPDDTVWGHTAPASNGANAGLKTEVAIVSRKLVAPHIAQLQGSKAPLLEPEWWVKAPGGGAMVVLGDGAAQPRNILSRRWRNLNLGLFLLLLFILCVAAITPTAQLHLRALQAANSYSALQVAAGAAVQQREQLVKFQQQAQLLQSQLKGSLHPELALLRVTQLLPDNTFLTSLVLQGDKVTITGQTPNTAVLMQQLGTQAGVRSVRAPVAATKQRGAEQESFSVEFDLDAADMGAKS